jgi:excisionase family DNA binding protein
MAESELMSTAEVGQRLDRSRQWVVQKCTAGELPHVRVGRLIKVPRSALDAYISALAERSTEALRPGSPSGGGS